MRHNKKTHSGSAALLCIGLFLTACGGVSVPDSFAQAEGLPAIYPDYTDITVPVNIAPPAFQLEEAAMEQTVVRFSTADGTDIVCGNGLKAQPDVDAWHGLAAKASGGDITVEVYARGSGNGWTRYQPFAIHVSPDSIDPYISYRLISPSYVTYEELTLNQRCLEDYREQVMVDNMLCATEDKGQCVNCHNYQTYNPRRMQFHARQTHGGTVIVYDGRLEKVDMRHDSLLSACVYPDWHPTEKLIAYSTDKTMQSFHTAHPNKIEVLDAESDLVLYDIDRHEVTTIERQPDELEVFPAWSPDGKSLYFCSAHFEYLADTVSTEEIIMRAEELKYAIYRKSFDPDTRSFGPRELVFPDTSSLNPHPSSLNPPSSSVLPRLSPDGRWLLFSQAAYGYFHIWHHDADLWLMDLTTGEARPLEECNSPDTESYHSWSSNGRWIVFSSRRHDGVFTRPFIAHIDAEGHGCKPFELPQADPDLHLQMLKSYNVPELMRGPITITPQQFADKLKEQGVAVDYGHQQVHH